MRNPSNIRCWWPSKNRIGNEKLFDPLVPDGEIDPHKRFYNTIDALNSGHTTMELIRFSTNGGERVCWVEGPRALRMLAARSQPDTPPLAVRFG